MGGEGREEGGGDVHVVVACKFVHVQACPPLTVTIKLNFTQATLSSTEWSHWQKCNHSCLGLFSSIQFSSRRYLCARESSYALHHVSPKFPPALPLKQFQCSSVQFSSR